MTVTDERPRNGHTVEDSAVPRTPLDVEAGPQDLVAAETPRAAAESEESEVVRQLRQRVADRRTANELAREYVELSEDPVLHEVPSPEEEKKDTKVAEHVRGKQRKERKRSGVAEVRRTRRNRRWDFWDERATRARDRILDPARAIGADYRKLVASSWAAFVLIAGGVAYMAKNVHDGLVGVHGSWTAYLVEPLASVLLAISMVAQFTARKRGITINRGFYWFDGSLALASVLLNVVPSGIRYGWQSTDLLAHLLVPALVVTAVIAWHLASNLYGQAIAQSKNAPIVIFRDDETTAEHLALLRRATANGQLPVEPSVTQVIKCLRSQLPNGIGHAAARRVAGIYLGGR
ncbi:hypothetical protein [Prauserella muralis]|uniref:Uncharacterized protein n=1 Tax=Prauserella muralis TaxID=588067 RepID=A0A2V4ACF0_9PSEU|nr:hypothetical protein [Prauserella muralis]PXY16565.1 hypothetical protein BAY60_35805 [Prauserella muralis]TWE11195.1 hypothetical protein FHX69_7414 [Prauserella muralis]